jgi:hypothetical protein
MCPRSRSKGARSLGFQYPSPLNDGALMQGTQARRLGPTKSDAKRQHRKRAGRRAKTNGACAGRPRLEGLEVEDYAALAFLAVVGRAAGFGWAFAVVFL